MLVSHQVPAPLSCTLFSKQFWHPTFGAAPSQDSILYCITLASSLPKLQVSHFTPLAVLTLTHCCGSGQGFLLPIFPAQATIIPTRLHGTLSFPTGFSSHADCFLFPQPHPGWCGTHPQFFTPYPVGAILPPQLCEAPSSLYSSLLNS